MFRFGRWDKCIDEIDGLISLLTCNDLEKARDEPKADNKSFINGFQHAGEQVVLIDSDYGQSYEQSYEQSIEVFLQFLELFIS